MSRAARLGAFILVTLAILVAGIFIIGSKEYLFTSTYQLKSQFLDVAGLEAGGDVRVGGIHTGTVRSIELPHRTDGKVTVVMDLDKSTHGIVKKDSIASIQTEGLLGSQFVSISFGGDGGGDVQSGDTIASQPPLQMADLLKKANGLLDSGKQALDNTTLITANLNSITGKINSGNGTIGALVNDRKLYDNLDQSTADLSDTMVHAKAGVTSFQEDMEALKHNFLLSGYFKKRGYEDSTDLTSHAIDKLPQAEPVKTFTFSGKQLFDKQESTKVKNEKTLQSVGEYLASNPFSSAVIVVSTGMEGDSDKDTKLSQIRALLVRESLVGHFGFDDSNLKTLGLGKQANAATDAEWGTVQVLIYPGGTAPAKDQQAPAAASPK